MNRNQLDEIIRVVAINRFGTDDDSSRSKGLVIYALYSMIENLYGYCCEDDIVNSITDAAYDRELDAIYYDDGEEEKIICYLIQGKYYDENSVCITYKDAAAFIESCDKFPNIPVKHNSLVAQSAEKFKIYQLKEYEIEKKPLLIVTGKIEDDVRKYLEDNNVEIYDFEKLNSQVFLDEFLPNIRIVLKQKPNEYDEDTLLGILDIGQMVKDVNTGQYIDSQSLFAYNIRGQMPRGKASIARQIENTCLFSPKTLFRKNNGITVVCNDFSNEGNMFLLEKASVVNGQQTIRTIRNIRDKVTLETLFVSIKILRLKGTTEQNKKQIIELAESANRQNTVKNSDLITNEEEQRLIYKEAIRLPEALKFIYKYKRDCSPKKKEHRDTLVLTKVEATNYIYSFIYENPNDRADDVMNLHYNKIFGDTSAKEIGIIHLIRLKVVELQVNGNKINEQLWNEMYDRFKKDRVINFCMYILAIILDEYYGYDTPQKRRILVKRIYSKMCKEEKYTVEQCFNGDFWRVHNTVCQRLLRKYSANTELTADYLRKPLADLRDVKEVYTQVLYDLSNMSPDMSPKVVV